MQPLVAAIVAVASAPLIALMLIIYFSSVIVGIWLAILGEWWAIGYGFAGFSLRFFLPIILGPSVLFALPAAPLIEKGKVFFAFPFLFSAQLYAYAAITGCCLFIFYIFMSKANSDTFWLLLVWSYFVALAPWVHFTQIDVQGGPSTMTTGFANGAYIIISVLMIFGRDSFLELSVIFAVIMLSGLLIQAGCTLSSMISQKRLGSM